MSKFTVRLLVPLFATYAQVANSTAIYEYSGYLFNGYMEFATPLAPNLAYGPVAPVSFNFANGFYTDVNTNSTNFIISTGVTGRIEAWEVNMQKGDWAGNEPDSAALATRSGTGGIHRPNEVCFGGCGGINFSIVGRWEVGSAVPVPVPSTIPQIALSLAALGYSRRRRKGNS